MGDAMKVDGGKWRMLPFRKWERNLSVTAICALAALLAFGAEAPALVMFLCGWLAHLAIDGACYVGDARLADKHGYKTSCSGDYRRHD